MREGTQALSTALGASIRTRACTCWHPATELPKRYQRGEFWEFNQLGTTLIFVVVIVDLLTQSSRQKPFCSVDNICEENLC